MIEQNSEEPTGVGKDDTRDHKNATRARVRKSNAALGMALAGASWDEIALALGFPTGRLARVSVEQALERRLDAEDKSKMRALAGARLERLLRGVWAKAIDPENPEQLIATSKAREVIADHRKLFGLDAPSEVIIHQPTRVELEEWVAKIVNLNTPPIEEDTVIDVEWYEDDPPAIAAGG